MELETVIRKPLVTEKGTYLRELTGQYIFEVDRRANKSQIKLAIEKLFSVQVTRIRTLNIRGKVKRVGKSIGKRANWKKAYVTLKKGSTIRLCYGNQKRNKCFWATRFG